MTSTYTQQSGSKPDMDEQHEARVMVRSNSDGSAYMMTEIGDGTFVQWSDCAQCRKRVGDGPEACRCNGGPHEPAYIERWRIQRFDKSFGGRGVEPALPVPLRTRDRRIDAVLRHLRSQGWTITNPEGDTVSPERVIIEDLSSKQRALLESTLASIPVAVEAEPDVDDERDHLETEPGGVGAEPFDPDKGTVPEEPEMREATEEEAEEYLAGRTDLPGSVETEHGLEVPTITRYQEENIDVGF